MPLKKIENSSESKKVLIIKGGVVVLLILLTYFSYIFLGNEPQESALKKPNTRDILGDTTTSAKNAITEEFKNDIAIIKQEIETLKRTIAEQGEGVFRENRQEWESEASDIINENAINPIITQIQKLPGDQREYLREKLCQ